MWYISLISYFFRGEQITHTQKTRNMRNPGQTVTCSTLPNFIQVSSAPHPLHPLWTVNCSCDRRRTLTIQGNSQNQAPFNTNFLLFYQHFQETLIFLWSSVKTIAHLIFLQRNPLIFGKQLRENPTRKPGEAPSECHEIIKFMLQFILHNKTNPNSSKYFILKWPIFFKFIIDR